jgi:hypothetical protein
MVNRTELLTLHILDLLEMLGTSLADGGSMTLRTDDGEELEVDLDNLCICVRIESSFDGREGRILPFRTA